MRKRTKPADGSEGAEGGNSAASLTRGLEILKQTQEVASRINNLLSPANQQAVLDAFGNVSRAATELEAIPRQLQPTLATLPGMTAQAQQTLSSLDTLSKNASALTTSLGSMANRLEYETLPLAHDMRSSIRALNRTLDSLNERPQSVLFGSPRAKPGPGEPGFSESPGQERR